MVTVLVSLRCFEGHPPEDVSMCGVLRCMWGGCERREFVVYCLVVLGILFWSSSGSGDLLLLDVEVAPSGRVWGVWVRDDWGIGGVLELVWEGCQGRDPRCSSLEVSRRCRLSQGVRMVVWSVFPRRVGVWWGDSVGLGWRGSFNFFFYALFAFFLFFIPFSFYLFVYSFSLCF
jgi:hypothetical protein